MDLSKATISQLIALALVGEDEDEQAWAAIRELHSRGDAQVLAAAQTLIRSEAPRERGRGVDILAQLGVRTFGPTQPELEPEDPPAQACADAMVELLSNETDPAVLNSLGAGLGHRPDARAIPLLVRQRAHADSGVRLGVVLGLTPHAQPESVAALIELSADEDLAVRNWATFGLGSQLEAVDTPALRDALVRRLADADAEVRGEALLGLSIRRDPRVLEPLRRELAADRVIVLAVEAAERLGDPDVLPLLRQLGEASGARNACFDTVLADAIAALEAIGSERRRP